MTRRLLLLLLFTLVVSACATTNPSGFRAHGEASWYGPGFEGRPTASGEPFNPEALTAAHKTLPFGTRVRVTNPANGRSVVVRINDRFPGTKGRVIDLSRASFAHIAPLAAGVVPVRLEIVSSP